VPRFIWSVRCVVFLASYPFISLSLWILFWSLVSYLCSQGFFCCVVGWSRERESVYLIAKLRRYVS
jgi:hypothetical protein